MVDIPLGGSIPLIATNLKINYLKTEWFETFGFDYGVWSTEAVTGAQV